MDLAKAPRFSDFTQRVSLCPAQYAILMHKQVIQYLTKKRIFVFVDDTFNIVKDKFLLMTVLLTIDGVPLPAAWLIHTHKGEFIYSKIFKLLKQLTDNQVTFKIVLCNLCIR